MPVARVKTHRRTATATSSDGEAVQKQSVSGAAQIRNKDLPVFTRALGAMLAGGLPLVEALHALELQTSTRRFAAVIRRIRYNVETGHRLAYALSQFPQIFGRMYTSMLRTGELSGRLAETLERIADYLESAADLRHRVRSAMMYPIIVGCIALLVAAAIMIWIMPAFEKIYIDLGGTLPFATHVLIVISRGVREHALAVLGVVIILWIAGRLFKRTEAGATALDSFALKVPVFGPLTEKLALCRFAESLSQLIESGIAITQALEVSAMAAGNRVLTRAIMAARSRVEGGDTLCEALRRVHKFPPLMIQMLTAGERTGKLDDMLKRTGEFYRNEVMITLKGLTSAVEPLMIAVLGVLVGGMVVCMFLPIFRLHEIVAF
jgi:type IV pilus assembly protein PilC